MHPDNAGPPGAIPVEDQSYSDDAPFQGRVKRAISAWSNAK